MKQENIQNKDFSLAYFSLKEMMDNYESQDYKINELSLGKRTNETSAATKVVASPQKDVKKRDAKADQKV